MIARLLADGQTSQLARLLELARDYRNLPEDQLQALLADLEEKVCQLASVLSLQLPRACNTRTSWPKPSGNWPMSPPRRPRSCCADRPTRRQPPAEGPLHGELEALAAAVQAAGSPHPAAVAGPHPGVAGALSYGARPQTAAAAAAAATPDPGLLGRLGMAVTACRQSRSPLSLLLAELDRTDELLLVLGVDGFDALRRLLESACIGLDHPYAMCTASGEAGFALILPKCERRLAVEMGDQLMQAMRRVRRGRHDGVQQPITLSVGVATLRLAAEKLSRRRSFWPPPTAVSTARAPAGGGVVKSIEI